MIDLSVITRGLIFLHGLSGAGKGELKNKIEEAANKDGVKVFYLASGDCFRAIKKKVDKYRSEGRESDLTPDEIKTVDLMLAGKQIPDLSGISDPVVEVVTKYIDAILKGEKAVIIFDGLLRNGEDVYLENEGSEPIRIPSQVLQVAEMVARALKLYFVDDEGKVKDEVMHLISNGSLDQQFVVEFLQKADHEFKNLQDADELGKIAQSLRYDSTHALVDVKEEDAEILMRFRSVKTITGLILNLATRENRDDKLDLIQSDLLDLLKLQSGRFEIKEDQIELLDISEPDRSFVTFGLDKDKAVMVDKKLQDIAENILNHLGSDLKNKKGENKQIKDALSEMGSYLGIKSDDLPRADDLPFLSRIARILEFKEKALEKIIKGELGVDLIYSEDDPKKVELDYSNSNVNPEKTLVIANGPSRGIGYEEYVSKALLLSMILYGGALGKRKESEGGNRKEHLQ